MNLRKINIKKPSKKTLKISVLSILSFTLILLSFSVLMPKSVKGSLDFQSLIDSILNQQNQLNNHEERITNLENKTDNTQTQTNQNNEDIKKLQENTGTTPAETVPAVHTPVVKTTPTTSATPTPPTTEDPNNNSWTNSHGTFVYKDFLKVSIIHLDKEFSFSGHNVYDFDSPCHFVLPAGAIGYKDSRQIKPVLSGGVTYPVLASSFVFDLRSAYPNGICNTQSWQQGFSNNPASTFFPGNYDIWW